VDGGEVCGGREEGKAETYKDKSTCEESEACGKEISDEVKTCQENIVPEGKKEEVKQKSRNRIFLSRDFSYSIQRRKNESFILLQSIRHLEKASASFL